jgi:hypothetical protein
MNCTKFASIISPLLTYGTKKFKCIGFLIKTFEAMVHLLGISPQYRLGLAKERVLHWTEACIQTIPLFLISL